MKTQRKLLVHNVRRPLTAELDLLSSNLKNSGKSNHNKLLQLLVLIMINYRITTTCICVLLEISENSDIFISLTCKDEMANSKKSTNISGVNGKDRFPEI